MGVAISTPGEVTTEVPTAEMGTVNEPPSGDMEGKLPVLPREWTEGYAEEMLGSEVVSRQVLTRTWFGQVLRYQAEAISDGGLIDIPDQWLIEALSKRTSYGDEKRFRSDMGRARRRVAEVLLGLFADRGKLHGGKHVRLSVDALRERRLKDGREGKALTNGLQFARSRVNWKWRGKACGIINTLADGRGLSDEEKALMEKLFGNHFYGLTYRYAWIGNLPPDSEFENLRTKLPEGYIQKADDSWLIGEAFLKEAGHFVGHEERLEDVFEIPENEIDRMPLLGVLEGRFAPSTATASAHAKPAAKRKSPASGDAASPVIEEVTIGSEISLEDEGSIKILPPLFLKGFEEDVLEGITESAAVFGLEVETIREGDSVRVVFLVHNGKFKHNGVRREGGRRPNFTNWFKNITSSHKLIWEIERNDKK